MKILFYNQYFWPENFSINDLVLSLKNIGHEVSVLTGQPNYPDRSEFRNYKWWFFSKELWNGIIINRIPLFPRGKSKFSLILNYLSFIISGILFSPFILFKKKYDVIFVYGTSPVFQVIPASFLGWLKGVPVVLWVQDLWPQSAEATGYITSTWLLKILEKFVIFAYRGTDLLLVQSEAFIKPVKKLSLNVPVIYHPNSVDNIFSSTKKYKTKVNSLKGGFNVMFAGNVGEAQSVNTILEAAVILKKHKEIKFIIVGNGSKINWLSNQIKKKSLNNIFLEGRYPMEEMPNLLKSASALLVSLKNQHIFSLTIPNKLQAYLAVGKPIIASLNGEGARIVKEAKAGLTANAEDPKSLAEAILKMYLMTSEERSKLGENGKKYFKKYFDKNLLVEKLIVHLKNISNKAKI